MVAVQVISIPKAPVTESGWMDDAVCKGQTTLFFPPRVSHQPGGRCWPRRNRLIIAFVARMHNGSSFSAAY